MAGTSVTDTNIAIVQLQAAVATRRTISPYDISPSDNPGCIISQPLLRGTTNYDEWSGNLKLNLMARKKFGFVDGSIPKPASDSGDLEDWLCNNALVVSWIKLTIDASLRTTLPSVDVACELWEHIKKRFSVKNGVKMGKIKAELATAHQNGRTVEEYFGHMTQLWSTLSYYRRPKICKCGLCTCELAAEIEKENEEDRVHEFLRGLDDTYAQIRSNLLSLVPFPSLDDVYLAVTQEEDNKSISMSRENKAEGMNFATRAVTRQFARVDRNGGRLMCRSCGRSGHTAEQCFSTIGYPDWWGDRPRKSISKPANDRVGMTMKNRASSSAHVVVTDIVRTPHVANAIVNSDDRVGLVGLNNAQWKKLLRMLEERNIENSNRLRTAS